MSTAFTWLVFFSCEVLNAADLSGAVTLVELQVELLRAWTMETVSPRAGWPAPRSQEKLISWLFEQAERAFVEQDS